MSPPRTVMDFIRLATDHLQASGVDTPRLDAEVLLGAALGLDRVQLYVQHDRPLNRTEIETYRGYVAHRAKKKPVAYIVGLREFLSLEFRVDERVLVPRPETEHLVEVACRELKERFPGDEWLDVADIGTGSGAVAVGLAKEEPRTRVSATDIDPDALGIAGVNIERHLLGDRITLRQGDLFQALGEGAYHAVLSNPPYISESEWSLLPDDVRRYEPQRALIAGPDGLDVIRRLVQGVSPKLHPGGFMAVEIGAGQGEAVLEIAATYGFTDRYLAQDFAGRDRVAVMAKEHRPS